MYEPNYLGRQYLAATTFQTREQHKDFLDYCELMYLQTRSPQVVLIEYV